MENGSGTTVSINTVRTALICMVNGVSKTAFRLSYLPRTATTGGGKRQADVYPPDYMPPFNVLLATTHKVRRYGVVRKRTL